MSLVRFFRRKHWDSERAAELESHLPIEAVVRRDQRNPVMGSPAVSCSSRQWRTAIMSGVFFPPEYDHRRCGAIGR